MLKIILCFLVIFSSIQANSEPLALKDWKQPHSEKAVYFTRYTSILNCEKKTPRYVYYNLLPEDFNGETDRKHWWSNKIPEKIKAVCGNNYAVDKDYRHSGYSRGHLNPSANYKASKDYMKETYSFANAAPQEQSFNGGLWKAIENTERKLAGKHSGITVITGVIHTGSTYKIKNDISVPVYFYKIVLWKDGQGNIHNLAWLVENDKPDKGIKPGAMLVDINTIENISGLDFID